MEYEDLALLNHLIFLPPILPLFSQVVFFNTFPTLSNVFLFLYLRQLLLPLHSQGLQKKKKMKPVLTEYFRLFKREFYSNFFL